MKLKVKADIKKNRLYFTFAGNVSKQEMDKLYTDTRFCVADMKSGFDVVSDYSECFLLHISGVLSFRKIMNYLMANNVGEIVRIVNNKSILYKQLVNLSSVIWGYRPIYVSTIEEAEVKLENTVKRNGIRFYVDNLPVEYILDDKVEHGNILNISTSGCAIESEFSNHFIGKEIILTLIFEKQKKVQNIFKTTARIVRVDDRAFAVQYKDIDDEQKVNLWKCLIDESSCKI